MSSFISWGYTKGFVFLFKLEPYSSYIQNIFKLTFPDGAYKDLARAFKDTISLMFVFTAIMPAAIGAILLFGIEPALGIQPGTNNPNWIEPVISIVWFVGLSLIVKWAFWPRKPWYTIPAT